MGSTVFTAPASINIDASAVDGNGSIAKVDFFSNSNKIGENFSPPFSLAWTNAAAGSCSLTVVATDNDGGSATSAAVAVTAVATTAYRINCGSSAASPFTADQYYSGGTARTVTNTISTTGVTNPAPQAVYKAERYGTSTYTMPGLTANAQYTVRLHFAELYQTSTGKRVFNILINAPAQVSNRVISQILP